MSEMPFYFRWCCNEDELCGNSDSKPNGYLQLGTPEYVTPTHITISNYLADKTITINPIQGASEASSESYHYKFAFNPGILAEPENISLESKNWSINYVGDGNSNSLYLLWTGEAITLNTNEAVEVILEGLAADSAVTKIGNTTDVTVSWKLDRFEIEEITRPGPPQPYETSIILVLEMVKTTGKSNIPLYVGFVGSNKVLNTNDKVSSLQLRVTNTNFVAEDSSNVTFHYDSNTSDCSRLVVTLEVGNTTDVPWALGTQQQVKEIGISIPTDGWNQNGTVEEITVGGMVKALRWTFTPQSTDVVLHAQETLLIDLESIVTAHPTGEANLYLRYEKVPDYQDGQFICQIEKAPLVFDHKVRVGTTRELEGLLTVKDGISLDEPGEIQHTGPLIFRSDVDNSNEESSVKFLKQNEPIPLMELKSDRGTNQLYMESDYNVNLELHRNNESNFLKLKAQDSHSRITFAKKLYFDQGDDGNTKLTINGDNGNVGIGTNSPSAKLEVDGRIKDITGYVIPVGTIVPYAGSTAPEGWLLCHGQSFSSSDYPELYNVLQSSHTPNLQGRFIIGVGNKDGYDYDLNETGGEEKHRLTVPEMPSHNHEYDSNYKYLVRKGLHTSDADTDDSADEINLFKAYPIQSAGGDKSHENRPPFYALNYIIKA